MPVFYTTPGIRGIGDALFVSAIAQAQKQCHPYQPIAVRNKTFQLFYNNPHVDFLSGYDQTIRGPEFAPREASHFPQVVGERWALNWLFMRSGMFGKAYNAHHGWPPQKRLLVEIAERCELPLSDEQMANLRPYFWPYRRELAACADYHGVICVHSSTATYWTSNKQWPLERIQEVVDRLVRSFRVVQLGLSSDAALANVEDLRGKTDLRQTAAILAQARLFIGMEGGLMHTARAVDTRSVIIFTGFITPEYTGYDVNVNVFGPVERSDLPCWRREPCNCDCAERVTVADMLGAVEQCLALPPLPKHYLN